MFNIGFVCIERTLYGFRIWSEVELNILLSFRRANAFDGQSLILLNVKPSSFLSYNDHFCIFLHFTEC